MPLRYNRIIEALRSSVRWRALAVAVLLVVAVYPDVIFMKASISLANYYFSLEEPQPRRVMLLREREWRGPHHGMSDAGGSVFQSEPGAQFMKNALWSFNSIFWNPHSAAGTYGAETLVDIKTSPVSMATALLGGSELAFHVAHLGLTLLGLWCLLSLLTMHLRLSLLAATAGGVMFLLGGYPAANLGSNVSQTWLLFPMLLLALAEYALRPRMTAFAAIVGATALVLASTFLPTTLLAMLSTALLGGAIALGHLLDAPSRPGRGRLTQLISIWGAQAAGMVGGLALLGALYLPIWEALQYLKAGEAYAARSFAPASLFSLISAFSPKHVVESYNALPQAAQPLVGNVVFHQGIIAALLASQACRAWGRRVAPVVAVAALLVVVFGCRAFGVPGVFQLVGAMPVIGSLGEQYIWMPISIGFLLLVAFGVEALVMPGNPRRIALGGAAIAILLSLGYAASVWGIGEHGRYYVPILVSIVVVGSAMIVLAGALRRQPLICRAAVTAFLFAELTFYVNHMRFERTDRFGHPPQIVRFLQLNAGLQRIASFGPYGLPPEYPSAYGLFDIGSMIHNVQPDYASFWNRRIQPDPKDRWAVHVSETCCSFLTFSLQRDKDRMDLAPFDFLGVRYAIVNLAFEKQIGFMKAQGWRDVLRNGNYARGGEPGVVLENPHALPRAWVVPALAERKLTPLDDGVAPLAVAYTEDPALIAEARRVGLPQEPSAGVAAAAVSVTEFRNARVELYTRLDDPGVLVMTDAWHPNWTVTVDGVARHLGRVDEAFRGVVLEPGAHTIEMRYRPRTLVAGQAVSLATLLALSVLLLLRRRIDPRLAHVPPA